MAEGAPERHTDTHTQKGAADKYTDTHMHVIKKRAGRRPAFEKTRGAWDYNTFTKWQKEPQTGTQTHKKEPQTATQTHVCLCLCTCLGLLLSSEKDNYKYLHIQQIRWFLGYSWNYDGKVTIPALPTQTPFYKTHIYIEREKERERERERERTNKKREQEGGRET